MAMTLEGTVESSVRILIELSRGDREEFVRQRAAVTQDYDAPAWIAFVRAWQEVCREQYPIPELINSRGTEKFIGRKGYRQLGIKRNTACDLLRKVFNGYGVFDDEKCKIFIDTKDSAPRKTLSKAFFEGEYAQENARTLVRYAWNHIWKQERSIPELVGGSDITNTVGIDVYSTLGVRRGNPSDVLRKVLPNYGIFDDTKCQVFIDKIDPGPRQTLSEAFFEGEYAQDNARTLVRYAWNHIWKQERSIPELVSGSDITNTVGSGVYRALEIHRFNPIELLRMTIEDYGVLNDEKTNTYIALQEQTEDKPNRSRIQSRIKLNHLFFVDSEHADANKTCYLEAYQRHYQKRRSDFNDEDYQRLPKAVRSWVSEQDGKREPLTTPREVGYHAIQIRWTPDLEAHLKALFEQHEQALFQRRDMLWSELGITPFAARMKVADLHLTPPIVFGTEPSARVASYAFVQYPHYSTSEGMLAAAQSLDDAVEIHIEGFESPVHRQGLHLQVPMLYKGIDLNEYTKREQSVLRTVATYLRDPNLFTRAADRKGLPCYSPPQRLVEPHTLVPIDTGTPHQLVKLYLDKQYAQDPGGVFTAVIAHNPAIFIFFHTHVGSIATA